MSFGSVPFGVGALTSSPEVGDFSTTETGVTSEIIAMSMTCDAAEFHGSESPDLMAFGFACDGFILSGDSPLQKVLPSAWVEDSGLETIWTPDASIAGIPLPTNPEE